MTEVVLLVACYNGRRYIGDCLRSLIESDDGGIRKQIVVADNASSDSSGDFIAQTFPSVDLIRLQKNVGFAGGMNAAWNHARAKFPEARYIAVINQDIIARSGWLGSLVSHLDSNPNVAAVQPKVLLWPEKERFNTAGNESHYLGFGLVTAYGRVDDGSYDTVREIDFPSGAAMVVRGEAIAGGDLFDELFFLYLEDAELGWRLRQLGRRIDYVPAAAVWHQYEYRHDYRYYFFLERNRWYLLAMYYKTPTILLLTPIFIAMELGQFYFAVRNQVGGKKLKACLFFCVPANLSRLLRRRREIQRRRRIGDREFVRRFVAEIDLPELRSGVLRRVGNPLLKTYWRLARPLIVW
jgi:GT2 family glycosyltransferase